MSEFPPYNEELMSKTVVELHSQHGININWATLGIIYEQMERAPWWVEIEKGYVISKGEPLRFEPYDSEYSVEEYFGRGFNDGFNPKDVYGKLYRDTRWTPSPPTSSVDVITTWEQLMQLPSDSLLMTESGYHVLWNAELKTITFSDASHSRLRVSEGLPDQYRKLTVLFTPEVKS